MGIVLGVARRKKIKEYLAYELAEELEKYNITIIA